MIKIKPIEIVTHIEYCTDDEKTQRWSICKSCEHYNVSENVDENKEFCSSCNCILNTKIPNKKSKCPEGKW